MRDCSGESRLVVVHSRGEGTAFVQVPHRKRFFEVVTRLLLEFSGPPYRPMLSMLAPEIGDKAVVHGVREVGLIP